MRWESDEEDRLKKLYKNKKIPIKQIIKKLKRTPASIHNKIHNLHLDRNRSPNKFKFPSKITVALARIHAHICGDGNLFSYREKDCYGYLGCYKINNYRYRFGLGYTNLNPLLIKEFIEDIKAAFGLKPYYRNCYVRVKSKEAWRLLKRMGAGKSHDWFISSKITIANKEIKKNWVRAFFDDEACFNANGRIRVRSVNRKGIAQVRSMLKEFLPCHITPKNGLYKDGSVYLNINTKDAEKFFSKIGSIRYKKSSEIN